MKISQLIKELEAAKKDVGDLEVVMSSDDEGNNFGIVNKNSLCVDFQPGYIALYPSGNIDF